MSYFCTSVGKKFLMAGTGTLLVLFVVPHLLGNLSVFSGADPLNHYAQFLQSLGPGLWLMRLVMLTAVTLHIWTGVRLWLENRSARPQPYAAGRCNQATTLSARIMPYSGLLLLGFILFHLLHFTFGVIQPQLAHLTDAAGRHDVYRMVVESFRGVGTVLVYTVGIIVLCLHIRHGFASLFQTLGLNTERLLPRLGKVSLALAALLLAGYLSIPFAALFHLLKVS